MTSLEKSRQISRLRILTDLVLDARLSTLHVAAAERDASLDRLADLDLVATVADLPDIAAAEVEMRYQRWADQRRAEINLTLARQTAAWIEAREGAALAFGKSQAMAAISERLK